MFVFLFLTIFILLIVDRWRRRRYLELDRTLGIDWMYIPFLGHAYKLFGGSKAVYAAIIKANTYAYNKKNGTISGWLGSRLMIGIMDPIQAIPVLKTAFNKTLVYKLGFDLFGNSIVFAPGALWHRRRKILTPTFAPRIIGKYIQIFEKNAKLVVQLLEPKVGKGNFSCYALIRNYAMSSICETTLGVDVNVQRNPNIPFVEAYEEFFRIGLKRVTRPWLHIDFLYKLSPLYSRQKYTKQIMFEFIDNIIYKKKEMLRKCASNNEKIDTSTSHKSFLELMIENSEEIDKGYTHEELREESLLLVLAGTDTTSTALGFIAVLLSHHQDVQEKVYKELKEVLGEKSVQIEIADLPKLKYMEAVIKEALRLYPPVPLIMRDSEQDLVLPSGVIVPKGCDVITIIAGINRNPHYWGTDAEYFKPERFLTEQTSVPNAFMSFSYGPRNCVGSLYAMVSMKALLVTILRQYRLLPATSFKYDENNPLRLSFKCMTKHVDNYEIQLEHRY